MKGRFLTLGVGAIGIAAFVISVINYSNQKKVAWFDYNKVYNDCDLKKNLEKDLEKVVSARKSELDSLNLELTFLSNKVKEGLASGQELSDFEDLKNKYLQKSGRYEEENYRLKENYFTQIRQEINDKAKSYGEANGYDYIFSAVGDGSLMFASEGDDITNDILKYVNK